MISWAEAWTFQVRYAGCSGVKMSSEKDRRISQTLMPKVSHSPSIDTVERNRPKSWRSLSALARGRRHVVSM